MAQVTIKGLEVEVTIEGFKQTITLSLDEAKCLADQLSGIFPKASSRPYCLWPPYWSSTRYYPPMTFASQYSASKTVWGPDEVL